MKTVIQRCSRAAVTVDNKIINEIASGFCLLCGICQNDTQEDLQYSARKIATMRIFADENGKFNYDIKQVGGSILAVSQFTLCADTKKGHRPSFTQAMEPSTAEKMFDDFCLMLQDEGIEIKQGIFGAHMDVEIVNTGPVTIVIDSQNR